MEIRRAEAVLATLRRFATPQAPIARVAVLADFNPGGVTLYAPGLPPGDHDLYCEPLSSGAYLPGNRPRSSE